MIQSRRSFMRDALLGAAAFQPHLSLEAREALAASVGAALADPRAPIAAIPGPKDPGQFTGDAFVRPHKALWAKADYLRSKKGIPPVTRQASVVVVGGGLSGLSAAYALRDLKPLVIEQATRFGGNSKGEQWGDLRFSIGAAYINPPHPASRAAKLLGELGLASSLRLDQDPYSHAMIGDQVSSPFWKGSTDPARSAEFERVHRKLREVWSTSFPEIPSAGKKAAAVKALDRKTLAQWVREHLGEVHPHVAEFFDEYCWSSFGGGWQEVSAAHGLNFLCADLAGIAVLPGGNSAITDALYRKLAPALGAGNLLTESLVVDVGPNADGARVCYEGRDGKLVSVQARSVIMCSPKFVVAKVVSGLPQDQLAAIAKLRYRAYLVANVLLKSRHASPAYDLFRLKGSTSGDTRAEAASRPFTDLIFGGWAAGDKAKRSVLTLYKPYAYDGARGELYAEGSYPRERAAFEAAVPGLLATLGIPRRELAGIRVTRWGHALPLAAAGLLADGTLELASRPLGGGIFFAQQDNYACPGFESALDAAMAAAASVRQRSLNGA